MRASSVSRQGEEKSLFSGRAKGRHSLWTRLIILGFKGTTGVFLKSKTKAGATKIPKVCLQSAWRLFFTRLLSSVSFEVNLLGVHLAMFRNHLTVYTSCRCEASLALIWNRVTNINHQDVFFLVWFGFYCLRKHIFSQLTPLIAAAFICLLHGVALVAYSKTKTWT